MTFRVSARALLTAPDGRALLVRIVDDVALDASDPVTDYWITVGGGVEPGESLEAAVVREVFEETGLVVDDPGPRIWTCRKVLTAEDGTTLRSEEHYYWCPVASTELSDRHLTDDERRVLREFRWWDLDGRDVRRVRIFPDGFVDAARDVLRHGRPATPVRL